MRPYRPGEEEAILQLLKTVFDGWPHYDLECPAIDHWRWRYQDSRRQPAVVVVHEDGGKIAGCIHSSPIDVLVGGEIFSACLGGDTALLKSHRGQRLIGPMYRQVVEERRSVGIRFSFGHTHSQKLIRSLRKTSYSMPVDVRHLVKIRSISRYLHHQGHRWFRFKALGFRLLSGAARTLHRFPRTAETGPVRVELVETFDDRFEAFWQQASRTFDWIVKRDRSYLNWRYADPRAGKYSILTAVSEDRLLGYAVTRIDRNKAGQATAYLVDLLCLDGRLNAADALLRNALNDFERREINAVHCLLPRDHPYHDLLLARGFHDSLERIIVWMRFTDPMPQQAQLLEGRQAGSVHYCYGDVDSI